MNKKLIVKIITTICILVICIRFIPYNILKIFRQEYFLNINSKNVNTITSLISDTNYELKYSLKKVSYSQELGDWRLTLYYINGKKETILFGDTQSRDLSNYIKDNGYLGSKDGKLGLLLCIIIIVICIIYIPTTMLMFELRKIKKI